MAPRLPPPQEESRGAICRLYLLGGCHVSQEEGGTQDGERRERRGRLPWWKYGVSLSDLWLVPLWWFTARHEMDYHPWAFARIVRGVKP